MMPARFFLMVKMLMAQFRNDMMQKITIWHNPRCSKSRQALEILQNHGREVVVRRYLDNPPSPREIQQVLHWLDVPMEQAMRRKEDAFAEAGLASETLSLGEKCAKMSAFPKVIERPIVFIEGKALIARPPEKLLPWLAAFDAS